MTDPTLDDDDPDDTAGDTPMSGTPLSLPTVAEQDAAIRGLLETKAYVSADGSPYVPDNLDVFDPVGDADMGKDESIPTKNWIPMPVSDSADYLDRPLPTYLDDGKAPTSD